MCPGDNGQRDNVKWGSYYIRPPAFSYTRNGMVGGGGNRKVDYTTIKTPAKTFLLMEEWEFAPMNDGLVYPNGYDFLTQRHKGMASMSFFDGHAILVDAIEFNDAPGSWRKEHYFLPE